MSGAVSFSVQELYERGKNDIPKEMVSNSHLIYSSPATLAFNSPGAEGFGVKRAGLSVPGSVMLIVSPGCCGRNTSSISTMKGYENRFFYLTMDETDLVTGRHLRRIPKAVKALAESLEVKPSVIMICITCVDALLGTDMERVCRKAEELVCQDGLKIRVRPCYMYALTREGRKPPMVHVRQSIYSLLEPSKKRADSVNLMGYFAPLDKESELRAVLRAIGVKKISEVSSCKSFEDFMSMSDANFNLVLNPEARPAAQDLQERLGIPSVELTRFYEIDRIAAQYDAFGAALGVKFPYESFMERAKASMKRFRETFPEAVFSVGEAINADPFELALALVRYGFKVREIFGTLSTDSYKYIRHLAALSPQTRVYSNLSPSMLLYSGQDDQTDPGSEKPLAIALGRDAGWYHPEDPCLLWGQDLQPFGFAGVAQFFDALFETVSGGRKDLYSSSVRLGEEDETRTNSTDSDPENAGIYMIRAEETEECSEKTLPPKGYRAVLTPFAPDQSGAVSVFYELGGITVICDAGGCTGNICGFDEPRWFRERSAVFSAGLRDMDAILGRDDRLVEKLSDAARFLSSEGTAPAFTAIIGTPVPAVIGTDFRALERMARKRSGLPCVGIDCDGMEYYDRGVSKAFLALFHKFGRTASETSDVPSNNRDRVGILGAQYMDLNGIADFDALRREAEKQYGKKAVLFGSRTDGIRAFEEISGLDENLVVSVSGLEAAKTLKEKYGIAYHCGNPLAEKRILESVPRETAAGKKILVIHEQVTANSCRKALRSLGAAKVDTASWFMMSQELREEGDVSLREESDLPALFDMRGYDMIIADPVMLPLIRGHFSGFFMELPHFAVSGKS